MAQQTNRLQYILGRQPIGHRYRRIWQILHLDPLLLLGLSILITYGLFILYSAANKQHALITSQAAHFVMAIIVMVIVAQISPQRLMRWAPWFYAASLVLLFLVLLTGHATKGAARWINLGGFRFQPSELAKLAVPMMLAWYYESRNLPVTLYDIIISAAIILLPTAMVMKQPDLGTAIVIMLSGACILLFAGMNWRWISAAIVAIIVALPILWHFMHSYQRQRVLTFLSPERDPLGAGYHIIQSKIAIGSGGLVGKGWLHGTQSHLHFLPENTTDFIFSVSAEEFGFIGALLLLAIYLLISYRGLYISSQAKSKFSRLLASSLSLIFFIAAFINIGMVSGILPVVGVPLPLISYSGTSMMTLLASFGIIMSIYGHQSLFDR